MMAAEYATNHVVNFLQYSGRARQTSLFKDKMAR